MKYQIGLRIKKYREVRNFTQKDFADQIGVSNSRVANWEQGANRPDVDILAKICLVLDVSANELLDIRLGDEELTLEERKLVQQYRMRPELQEAIKKLLDF